VIPAPPAGARVELTCLGTARVTRGGVPLHLPPRRLEILVLLALEPEGFTPERLRESLYGDRTVTASTFKAEVSHLRHALSGAVSTRRYALTTAVVCDAVEVLRALERGDTATAVAHYRGPLLPLSEAPGVVAWRAHLEVAVREAVLAAGRPEYALRYGERAPYDAEVHAHALRLLGPGDIVTLQRSDGRVVRYQIQSTRIVSKGDTSVLRQDARTRLTLITCYPFDAIRPGTPLRWVVVAQKVA